ncbi:MAG TPA: prepilin-type N-terminal cleavage/methylation domain-containing protein [Candidatus Nanoarchaeia archaeon]|nr:prepilin-type N-terminal cleavage/methylation domain-containing protein [Candidatus Nanoarchaeia archaeon]
MSKLLKKESGFTLIELIIVMVIIGILVLLLLPNLSSGPKRARDSQRKSDLRTVQSALEHYHADKNAYPSGDYSGLSAVLTPDYAKTMPTAPNPGVYTYTPAPGGCTTDCSSYTLTADLEYNKDASYPTYTVNSAQ